MDIKQILKEETTRVKPDSAELGTIRNETKNFIEKLKKTIKKKKVKAEVFLGGSLAKGTIMKKSKYDIDIFVRFEKGVSSDILEKILRGAGIKVERIHGSRDYFRTTGKIMFEIVPVKKIGKAEEAENITDLSYFHVSYITGKTKKNVKLGDEIIIAKYFCYVNDCYGAEGHIRGFSGYALELLVSYYGSFLNFLKAVSNSSGQIVLDPEKYWKNKQEIMQNLNESKLQSPIVFVDPTFKQRNALAALSKETFDKFQKIAESFLKHPSSSFFKKKEINEKNFNLIINIATDRQAGDIAGSKLYKFFRFISSKLENNFTVSRKDFVYDEGKRAKCYFSVRSKPVVFRGPPVDKAEHLAMFRQKHRGVFVKSGIAYAKGKTIGVKDFLKELKSDKTLKEMSVKII